MTNKPFRHQDVGRFLKKLAHLSDDDTLKTRRGQVPAREVREFLDRFDADSFTFIDDYDNGQRTVHRTKNHETIRTRNTGQELPVRSAVRRDPPSSAGQGLAR